MLNDRLIKLIFNRVKRIMKMCDIPYDPNMKVPKVYFTREEDWLKTNIEGIEYLHALCVDKNTIYLREKSIHTMSLLTEVLSHEFTHVLQLGTEVLTTDSNTDTYWEQEVEKEAYLVEFIYLHKYTYRKRDRLIKYTLLKSFIKRSIKINNKDALYKMVITIFRANMLETH